MLFKYKALNDKGEKKDGEIDASSKDSAISALQRRGLIVVGVSEAGEKKSVFKISFFEKIPVKDVVILSRQIATLFEAQVSALKAFTMLASNVENRLLAKKLNQISDDIQSGVSISGALSKHPDVFSNFYVNMVKAGEESGKLNQTFLYLADYLDRQYELTSKTRNALIYPAFVIAVFFAVMILMFIVVIPKLSAIILESGQAVPIYTRIVIASSNFFVNYGVFFLVFLLLLGVYVWRLTKTEKGKFYLDSLKIQIPAFGDLFKKLYLSRIADNMDTMLSSGISIVRAIEITSEVVGNKVYADILKEAGEAVKGGASFSDSLAKHSEVPSIMVQMVKVGEETGAMSSILKTLATFYKREVDDSVDTLVGLIEPIMIVVLGLGVGILLTSVLVPIYNIAGGIS
jgi:type IV pilus assembly protein PilC